MVISLSHLLKPGFIYKGGRGAWGKGLAEITNTKIVGTRGGVVSVLAQLERLEDHLGGPCSSLVREELLWLDLRMCRL